MLCGKSDPEKEEVTFCDSILRAAYPENRQTLFRAALVYCAQLTRKTAKHFSGLRLYIAPILLEKS